MAAIIPVDAMPTLPDGSEFEVEMFARGQDASAIKNVRLIAAGIESKEGEMLVKYEDVEKCWMCYNIVKEMNEIKAENPCCARFSIGGAENFICSNRPVGECEEKLKLLLKKAYNDCKTVQPDATASEPLTCGTDADYKQEADAAAAELEANNPGAAAAEADKLLDDLLADSPSSGVDGVEDLVAKIAAILQSISVSYVVSTTITTEGTTIVMSDGSTTFQRNDGTTIITTTDGYTLTITSETTMITSATSTTTINNDSSMVSIDTATNTISNVSNTGEISV